MSLEERLDPEYRPIFSVVPDDLFDMSDIGAARRRMSAGEGAPPVEYPEGLDVEDCGIPASDGHTIGVRVYRPEAARSPAPALCWMHGGGFVMGDLGTDDAACAAMAAQLGVVVVSVDYRLAPEHPCPAPLEDCFDALMWMFSAAADMGIDPSRVAAGGASTGGTLAAGLCLLTRDRGRALPCFQLLTYAPLDDRHLTPSSRSITDGRFWNLDANKICWDAYLDGRAGSADVSAYAAPARAEDLSGLPPAFISVGEVDLFVDENVEHAQRLMRAGVPTDLHVYAGAFHGANVVVPQAQTSQRWNREILGALDRALNQ